MRFIFQLLALSALVARGTVALTEGVRVGERFGGPHGTEYSDMALVAPGQTVQSISIRAGERIHGVGIDVTDSSGMLTTLYHGGRGGHLTSLLLPEGECITGMEAHWGEKGDHTRIKFIKFSTSANSTVSGGTPTKNIGKDSQLGGFVGTSGKELDSVSILWTSIDPVDDDYEVGSASGSAKSA